MKRPKFIYDPLPHCGRVEERPMPRRGKVTRIKNDPFRIKIQYSPAFYEFPFLTRAAARQWAIQSLKAQIWEARKNIAKLEGR